MKPERGKENNVEDEQEGERAARLPKTAATRIGDLHTPQANSNHNRNSTRKECEWSLEHKDRTTQHWYWLQKLAACTTAAIAEQRAIENQPKSRSHWRQKQREEEAAERRQGGRGTGRDVEQKGGVMRALCTTASSKPLGPSFSGNPTASTARAQKAWRAHAAQPVAIQNDPRDLHDPSTFANKQAYLRCHSFLHACSIK